MCLSFQVDRHLLCFLTNMLKILKEQKEEEKCNENKNKIVEFDG